MGPFFWGGKLGFERLVAFNFTYTTARADAARACQDLEAAHGRPARETRGQMEVYGGFIIRVHMGDQRRCMAS
eukprot:3236677-Pyramimonas_sp.AAC.1